MNLKNIIIGIKKQLKDELLAIDLTEQKEFDEANRAKKIKRRLKDSVSTYVLSSTVACSALLSQVIDIIQ